MNAFISIIFRCTKDIANSLIPEHLKYLYGGSMNKIFQSDFVSLDYLLSQHSDLFLLDSINKRIFITNSFSKIIKHDILINVQLYIIIVIVLILIIVFQYKKNKELKSKLQQFDHDLQNRNTKMALQDIIQLAKKNDASFLTHFADLYPNFICNLKTINPKLEQSELVFCSMIKLNFSSKEIAQCLVIQHTSVQRRKNRIRKKFSIPDDVNIYEFFSEM